MKVLGIQGEPSTDDHGNVSAFITVEGAEGSVLLRKKPPFVNVGEELTGYQIVEKTGSSGKPYKKLERVQQNGWGGGGRKDDPSREAKIIRQHSEDMAIGLLVLAERLELPFDGIDTTKDLFERVVKLADAFDRDVQAAAQKVNGQ